MFKVIINDGTQEFPDDDIFYVVAKEGTFIKKRIGVMESLAPVQNISVLNSITGMAKMHIKPLPAIAGARILDFFKQVYEKYSAEAVVILFYDESSKKYKIIAPDQTVSGGSANYKGDISIKGYTMIGTIHSHASMSASHSGVDSNDEKSFDGLHITFGNMNNDEISISASIVANGSRFMVDPQEYLSGLQKTKDIDEERIRYATAVYKWNGAAMTLDTKASSKSAYTSRYIDKRYIYQPWLAKYRCDPKWLENVKAVSWNFHGWQGYYNPAWYGKQQQIYKNWWENQYSQIQSPYNVGPASKVIPLSLPQTGATPTNPNPCLTCKYKDIKLADELEDDDIEIYLCEQCNTIVKNEDGEDVICPICKTDEHLIAVDTEELSDDIFFSTDDKITHVEKEWECPNCKGTFGESEIDIVNHCPYCNSFIELGQQEFLGQTNEQHDAILAAAEADKYIERIPDPKSRIRPLSFREKLRRGLWKYE